MIKKFLLKFKSIVFLNKVLKTIIKNNKIIYISKTFILSSPNQNIGKLKMLKNNNKKTNILL